MYIYPVAEIRSLQHGGGFLPKSLWTLVVNQTRIETFSSVWSAMQYARAEFLIEWSWRPDGKDEAFEARHEGTESMIARIHKVC